MLQRAESRVKIDGKQHRKGLALAALLCATPALAQSITQQTPRNQELTAAVGSIVWEKAVYAGERVIKLQGEVSQDVGKESEVVIKTGTPMVIVRPKKLKACVEQAITNIQGVDYFNWHLCLIDSNDDGTFDRAASDDFGGGKPLATPIPYTRPPADTKGAPTPFHWTLTYEGKAGNSFRFTYKVFVRDPQRADIQEEVVVPLKGPLPQTAKIKDITLTMLDTGISGLSYRIDQGADAPGSQEN